MGRSPTTKAVDKHHYAQTKAGGYPTQDYTNGGNGGNGKYCEKTEKTVKTEKQTMKTVKTNNGGN